MHSFDTSPSGFFDGSLHGCRNTAALFSLHRRFDTFWPINKALRFAEEPFRNKKESFLVDKYIGTMAEIYEQCVLDVGASASVEELVRCAMTRRSLSTGEDTYQYASTVLLVIAAALVVFMQAGFAMVCAGCVQRKNVQNTLLKNLLDSCGVALAYFSIGYAFSYGDMDGVSTQKRFIGATKFFLQNEDDLGK